MSFPGLEPTSSPPGGFTPAELKLACVTGYMVGGIADSGHIFISNQKNINVSSWQDVFIAYPFIGGENNWGLACKDGWINTGCSSAWLHNQGDYAPDIPETSNGCFSDNEEIWTGASVFTTCCKIIE